MTLCGLVSGCPYSEKDTGFEVQGGTDAYVPLKC
jgi:hypothetical protein